METTMKDDAHLKRERQKRKLKVIFAVAMGIVPIATFFLPYVNYTFKDSTFVLSAYQILTSPGIRFQGYLISIPLLSKIAVLCGAVLALTGGALLLLKKPGLAGTGFVLSAATPLIVLMTSSSIQTAVTSLGVSNIIISYQWPFLLTLILGLAAGVLAIWTKGGEKLAESIFRIFACVSVGSVVIITVYMIVSGAPAIAEIGLGNFLFGTEWEPKSGVYGILPLILSSIAGTVGAVIIGVPIGILTAVFLSETAPKWVASVVRPAVQLLAGIPSVVYGFFGMIVLVPAVQAMVKTPFFKTVLHVKSGKGMSLFTAAVLLGIMILPTIITVSKTSLDAVPNSYYEGSLALGATHERSVFCAVLPAAKSGVLSAVILGIGRAIGETMAVVMVAGNQTWMPKGLFQGLRTMTSNIVIEMGYAADLHREALIATGVVLFVFILLINLCFSLVKGGSDHA